MTKEELIKLINKGEEDFSDIEMEFDWSFLGQETTLYLKENNPDLYSDLFLEFTLRKIEKGEFEID